MLGFMADANVQLSLTSIIYIYLLLILCQFSKKISIESLDYLRFPANKNRTIVSANWICGSYYIALKGRKAGAK